MGWNLVTDIEDEETGLAKKLFLPRAHAGITTSAVIAKGDYITFDRLRGHVLHISHDHVPIGSERSPNSVGYVQFPERLTADDIALLMFHGWKY